MVIGLAIPVTRYDQTTVEVDINPCDLPPSAGPPLVLLALGSNSRVQNPPGEERPSAREGGCRGLRGGHVADPLSPTSATVRR